MDQPWLCRLCLTARHFGRLQTNETQFILSLLEDFRGGANGEVMQGRIYNPENGRTYRASLKLRSPDILEVKGCLLIVCDTQVWRRVESLCGTPPKQT